jgi:DoxX-like family
MARKVIYWTTTVILAGLSAFAGFSYLTASPEAVAGFAHVGYPQHLRVILGIAKAAGAVALLVPGFPMLKEWAYAGFTFAWISAFVAHYVAGDGPASFVPLGFLVLLGISYLTRPDRRQWRAAATVA